MKRDNKRPTNGKVYYKIGEVADLLEVPASTIRFWEEQFYPFIRPFRTKSKHRVYSRKDVNVFMEIKQLVHELGYSIVSAKDIIRNRQTKEETQSTETPNKDIEDLRKELLDLKVTVKDLEEKLESEKAKNLALESSFEEYKKRWSDIEKIIRSAITALTKAAE